MNKVKLVIALLCIKEGGWLALVTWANSTHESLIKFFITIKRQVFYLAAS